MQQKRNRKIKKSPQFVCAANDFNNTNKNTTDSPQTFKFHSTGPTKVNGQLFGKPATFIVDSGSAASLIDSATIGDKKLIPIKELPLRSASNHILPIKGAIKLSFQLGNKHYVHPFCVIENFGIDTILGTDFLSENNALIDYNNYKVRLTLRTQTQIQDINNILATLANSNEMERQTVNTELEQPEDICAPTLQNIPADTIIQCQETPEAESANFMHTAAITPTDKTNKRNWMSAAFSTLLLPQAATKVQIIYTTPELDDIDYLAQPRELLFNRKSIIANTCIFNGKNQITEIFVTNISRKPKILHAGEKIAEILPVENDFTIVPVKTLKPDEIIKQQSEQLACATEHVEFGVERTDPAQISGKIKSPSINPELTEEQQEKIKAVLDKYKHCFVEDGTNLTVTNKITHKIETKGRPIKCRPYRETPAQKEYMSKIIPEMEKNGVIRRSKSPWSSPVILVKKSDGTFRFVCDLRKLNEVTEKDATFAPPVDDILNHLGGNKYFAILDMVSAYWQVPMDEDSIEKTAFNCSQGHWEFIVMPYGLTNAGATFTALGDSTLGELKWICAICYIDDLIVFAATFEEFLENLDKVLAKFATAGLKFKSAKCKIGYQELDLLGYNITPYGILPAKSKAESITSLKKTKNLRALQSFLGAVNFFRKSIPNLAKIAKPLYNLCKKDVTFNFDDECIKAWEKLKSILASPPLLAHYRPDLPVEIHVDASYEGIGASLIQVIDNIRRPIAYASRKLLDREANMGSTALEATGVLWALTHFKYFLNDNVGVYSDHHNLCYLFSKRDLTPQLMRIVARLQEFKFKVYYVKGTQHNLPDCLSRYLADKELSAAEKAEIEQMQDIPVYFISEVQNESATDSEYHSVNVVDFQNIQQKQEEDEFCKKIIDWLNTPPEQRPSEATNRVKGYELRGGILYRRGGNPRNNLLLLVLPTSMINDVIKSIHDAPDHGAHLGVQRTLDHLHARFYFPNSIASVKKFIRSCAYCLSRKRPPGQPTGALEPIPRPVCPGESWGIDALGPFKTSESNNKYVICALDYSTRFAVCKAVPNINAETTCQFIYEELICKYAGVKNIISDRGKNFLAKSVEDLCTTYGISRNVTVSYRPQSNGLTERFNKTLVDMIAAYINSDQTNWDKYLQACVFAYNASKHSTLQESPYSLMFRRQPVLGLDADVTAALGSEYAEQLQKRAILADDIIAQHFENSQRANEHRYNERHNDNIKYEPGDWVCVWAPFRKVGLSTKLLNRWTGPAEILEKIGEHIYRVRMRKGKKDVVDTINVSHLKPYFFRE